VTLVTRTAPLASAPLHALDVWADVAVGSLVVMWLLEWCSCVGCGGTGRGWQALRSTVLRHRGEYLLWLYNTLDNHKGTCHPQWCSNTVAAVIARGMGELTGAVSHTVCLEEANCTPALRLGLVPSLPGEVC
jgi:hypothetical protein